MSSPRARELRRRLGTTDAVVIGLGSMIGAGVFTAFAPAAAAAGSGLPIALATAAVVAYCNAISSARLAAQYPQSGGTYVYARRRLGPFWGYLAGWAFLVGKTASSAAMALTVGAYAWPAHAHAVAVATVVAVTAVNYCGVQKSAAATKLIVAAVLAVLALVVVIALSSDEAHPTQVLRIGDDVTTLGVLHAAGLLFFAFAGYARIATLGEEVRDPARVIPRAIGIALGIALVVYAAVSLALSAVLGGQLAVVDAPLSAAVRAVGAQNVAPIVSAGAVLAAVGSLLALILGVSRTTLAMARDHHLPHALAAVHPRFGVPHRAELAVGLVVIVLAATVDLRGAIGFSSFGVLLYYAMTHAAAWTSGPADGGPRRIIPVVGFLGCVVLAFTLPPGAVITGMTVLGVGAVLGYASGARGSRDKT